VRQQLLHAENAGRTGASVDSADRRYLLGWDVTIPEVRAALVELHIDPSRELFEDRLTFGAVLLETLRRHAPSREAAVLAAVRQIVSKADWAVFPGWTLIAEAIPPWLAEASRTCTMAFELVHPDPSRPAETHVLQDGISVVHASQRVYVAGDDPAALIKDIKDGTRYFPEGMLWICGEIEILDGGNRGPASVRSPIGLSGENLRRDITLNVAHTSERLPASKGKRAWLSTNGWFLRAANTHSRGWIYWDPDATAPNRRIANASHGGAYAWRKGAPYFASTRRAIDEGPDHITWLDAE
jgi:hypothetical protein